MTNSENSFQMKLPVVHSLKQFYGKLAVFARIASMKNPTAYRVQACEKELTNAADSKRHFTITTKTPMHCTKLPLWKWLLAMYLIVNSSKGISSVYLGKLIGISQKSAWKLGHAIRKMMDPGTELVPALCGIVEIDEKYIGGKPRYQKGIVDKRGKGTDKQ